MSEDQDNPLELAIERMGGLNQAARAMEIGTSAITNWRLRGRVPVARAIWLEQATGVPARDLAPWFFNRLDDRESA
jgi:hypothetical protein